MIYGVPHTNCRGNPWTDAPRSQQSIPGHVGDGTGHEGVYSNSHVAHAVTTLIVSFLSIYTLKPTCGFSGGHFHSPCRLQISTKCPAYVCVYKIHGE